MARIEAIARGLFYPTPEAVYERIANHLEAQPTDNHSTVRLLDPCAGTGEPAAHIAKALDAESYGIELNSERARAARGRMDHLLHDTAFGPRLQHGGFSVLFLNPPYDSDEETKRMEHHFLSNLTNSRPVLAPGGVLVFIVNRAILRLSASVLAAFYSHHRVYRFPDPEYAQFGQVVVLAKRRQRVLPDNKVADWFRSLADAELTAMPEFPEPNLGPMLVPALPRKTIAFAPASFDPEMAIVTVRKQGVWSQMAFRDTVNPPTDRRVRPLMPFRTGHRAIIVASGLINNRPLVHPQTGQRLLVKGHLEKIKTATHTDEENVTIETEKLKTSITTLDLSTGEIITLEDGSAAEATPAADEHNSYPGEYVPLEREGR